MKRILAILFALGAIASAPAYGADETAADNVPAPGPTGRFTVVSLEIGIAALQAYDGYSTVAAINRGATESNAIMSGLVSHPPAFLVVKGALAGVTIVTAEQLWRQHHRTGAIALLLISNGMMAVVAANNASVLRQVR